MNGYYFTVQVRESLARAREEAARLRHQYVGTEHLLLGMTAVPSTATAILEAASVDPHALRDKTNETLRPGTAETAGGSDIPYTSRSKKVLELAMSEARDLGQDYVGAEHLLIGLLREERGIAAQVLAYHGLTIEVARAKLRALGSPMHASPDMRSSSARIRVAVSPLFTIRQALLLASVWVVGWLAAAVQAGWVAGRAALIVLAIVASGLPVAIVAMRLRRVLRRKERLDAPRER
jgi:ATP-dependent Clp protease ATP-binding subunit ClpA